MGLRERRPLDVLLLPAAALAKLASARHAGAGRGRREGRVGVLKRRRLENCK